MFVVVRLVSIGDGGVTGVVVDGGSDSAVDTDSGGWC